MIVYDNYEFYICVVENGVARLLQDSHLFHFIAGFRLDSIDEEASFWISDYKANLGYNCNMPLFTITVHEEKEIDV